MSGARCLFGVILVFSGSGLILSLHLFCPGFRPGLVLFRRQFLSVVMGYSTKCLLFSLMLGLVLAKIYLVYHVFGLCLLNLVWSWDQTWFCCGLWPATVLV